MDNINNKLYDESLTNVSGGSRSILKTGRRITRFRMAERIRMKRNASLQLKEAALEAAKDSLNPSRMDILK